MCKFYYFCGQEAGPGLAAGAAAGGADLPALLKLALPKICGATGRRRRRQEQQPPPFCSGISTFLFAKLARGQGWVDGVLGWDAACPPYIISAFMLFYVLLIDVSALEAIYIPFLAKESAKELRNGERGR